MVDVVSIMRLPSLTHRLIATVSLLAFVSASLGFPVLRRDQGPQKDRSRPFPCQDSACGCMSADECWRGCCCHSNQERLAWAKAHQVPAPAFLIAAAEQEIAPAKSCCAAKSLAKKSCCETKTARCCDSKPVAKSSYCAPKAIVKNSIAKKPLLKWLNTLSALKCRGLSYDWVSLGAVDVPPPVETTLISLPIEFITLGPVVFDSMADPPAVPPPRGTLL